MTDATRRTEHPEQPSAERPGGGVVLSAEHLAQLEQHARQTYPEECCGVLIGKPGEAVSVCSVHPTENLSSTRLHDRYEVDPREILKLDRAAEQRGLEIVGFYHSHPDHPPAPSATDAESAWPGYIYLIVAVAEVGEAQVTAWTFDEERGRFRECPIRMSQEAPRPRRAATRTRR
jgi:proteasome lid subunit RPN8/RPN11